MPAQYEADSDLLHCVSTLRSGGVIAYPTEAVWGLGCDPKNRDAIQQVLRLKRRQPDKGLILVASHVEQFHFILRHLSNEQRDTLTESWPGPFTWLVPHHQEVDQLISGEHASVALRVSAHPLVKALCDSFGGPIVSTSANRQGMPAATTRAEVIAEFGQELALAPGSVGRRRKPSEIRDLISGQVIRA
jgi:L-threonylcarbamoyladenylate synthase